MASVTERNITKRLPTDDTFKTSMGVGHHWRPGYYFPDSKFHSSLRNPLPPVLAKPSEILPTNHFKTTTSTSHDEKYPFGPLQHLPYFKKSPDHNKVHYLKDFMEKIPEHRWRRPLSPRNQKSETHDEFCIKAQEFEPEKWLSTQNFKLYNHHIDGPSKKIIASTENPKLKSYLLYPKDKEVLRCMDPYLTTNMEYHRIFDPKEWNGIGRKNIPTYWDCEEYPKVLGFGPKSNLVPKSSSGNNPSLTDTVIFKSPVFIRRFPSSGYIVPHNGMLSEYDDKYLNPSESKSKESNICPINYPCPIPDPNLISKYEIPQMYETEYANYGKTSFIVS